MEPDLLLCSAAVLASVISEYIKEFFLKKETFHSWFLGSLKYCALAGSLPSREPRSFEQA